MFTDSEINPYVSKLGRGIARAISHPIVLGMSVAFLIGVQADAAPDPARYGCVGLLLLYLFKDIKALTDPATRVSPRINGDDAVDNN